MEHSKEEEVSATLEVSTHNTPINAQINTIEPFLTSDLIKKIEIREAT